MAKRRRQRRRQGTAGWVWMSFGLVCGLAISAVIYTFLERIEGDSASPTLHTATLEAGEPPAAASEPGVTKSAETASDESPATGSAQSAEAARAASADAEASRFRFFDELPNYKVVVPEIESPAQQHSITQQIEEPGTYVLQAASLRAADDAERLKANLALLGIESRVQVVTIDDVTFHRVRIGPIEDLEQLNRYRQQLADAGIDPLVMRIAE